MPTVNLTSLNDTLTTAAGDYTIYGGGGNDTITTGAGNGSIIELNGNNTITMGAGNNTVNTGMGDQTITTGAGISNITTGAGNSTITTGAGGSTIHAGDGNNTITTGAGGSIVITGHGTGNNTITTGAGGSTVTTYGGNDTITTGAGDSVVDSGTGNDTVTTAAGNDTIIYHHTGNVGNLSTFTAGTGIDTLKLVLSNGDRTNSAVQADIANYLTFVAANKGATGEDGAAAFTFKSLGLTASMFEKLDVTYDAPPQMTAQLYAANNSGWSALLQRDGVWVAPSGGDNADLIQHSVIRQFTPTAAGTYTFKFSVDDIGSVYLDGHSISGLLSVDRSKPWWTMESQATVNLDTSTHNLQFDVRNTGGPAGFALEVTNSAGNVDWHTGNHLDSAVLVGVYTPVTVSLSNPNA